MSQQKILLATPDYPPARGGVARYLQAIKKTFPERVDVLHWTAGLPSRSEMLAEFRRAAKTHRAIWTSHIFPIGTAALIDYLTTKTPYVVILHGMDFDLARRSWWRKGLAWLILRFAQRVVANSRALADEIESFSGRKDVLVVYPVVQDEFIQQVREKAERHHQHITLLSVSRLVKRKGHLKVLQVLKDFPEVQYQIVGDGPDREVIEKKISELGLSNQVSIHTDVDDKKLSDFYQWADIFVLPTTKTQYDREGFGIVYLEAQLFGLPVIATKHPGVDEAIVDKGTGLLIEDHPDALKFALEQMIKDRDLRERMGQAGREFVLAGFTREKQFTKLKELL